MSRFIQQKLFDVGAAAIARIHRTGVDLDVTTQRMTNGYQRNYADEDLAGKWKAAAVSALDILNRLEVPQSLTDAILVGFQHYAKNFDRSGRKLSLFKRFGGTLFHYEREPIPDLVEKFAARFAAYAAMAKTGILREEWVQ